MTSRNETGISPSRAGQELLARGDMTLGDISVTCAFTGTEWRPQYTISGRQGEQEIFRGSSTTLGGAFNCLPIPARRSIAAQLRRA